MASYGIYLYGFEKFQNHHGMPCDCIGVLVNRTGFVIMEEKFRSCRAIGNSFSQFVCAM